MEPVLILLVIPFIAFMMLRADSLRTNGMDAEIRNNSRNLLPVITIASWIIAVLFLILGLRGDSLWDASYPAVVVALARFSVGLGLFYLGWKAWRVAQHVEQDDLSLREIVHRDIEATSARTAAIVFVLLPLVLPAMLAMCTIGFVPILLYSFGAPTQRLLQNQLLWTLALAAKNQADLAVEVQALANSLSAERPSAIQIVVRSLFTVIGLAVLGLLLAVLQILFLFIFFLAALVIMSIVMKKRKRRQLIQKLNGLSRALYDGIPLADALNRYPGLVPEEVIGGIESAASTGDMAVVLQQMALEHSQSLEQRQNLGATGTNTAMYATMTAMVLFQVTAFIMYWIVPKHKEIFMDFGLELPKSTEALISVADFFANYWYLVGPIIFLPLLPLAVGSLFLLDEMTWVPDFLKRIFPRVEAPTLLRRLGYVAKNHRRLEPSLTSFANATVDIGRARRIERIENRLGLGDTLGTALSDEGFVNSREAYSIDRATETGHLGWALGALANSIQQRRVNRSRYFMESMRPIVIICLAVLVAGFCVAMFLPIVKLMRELAR